MISAVEAGEVDAAFTLTDSSIAAISRGANIRLICPVVTSPLTWAIVTANSSNSILDLLQLPWAISRKGSGSDVMLGVLAHKHRLPKPKTVLCGNFSVMCDSIRSRKAAAFLWERSTTRGLLRRSHITDIVVIDDIVTPWSAFCCIARHDCKRVIDVKAAVAVFLTEAKLWCNHLATVLSISQRHAMTKEEASEWLNIVQFADVHQKFDVNALSRTRDILVRAGVIANENSHINILPYSI